MTPTIRMDFHDMKDHEALDIQIVVEKVFEHQNISWGSAFRGSKHLPTDSWRILDD